MREILFRAKRTDNGEWVKGNIIEDGVTGQVFIHARGNSVNESDKVGDEGLLNFFAFEVDPETVCQYTGKSDVDKNLIFEHDALSFLDTYSTESGYAEAWCIGEVVWDEETLSFQVTERLSAESFEVLDECKVLGNTIDNPELLEGGTE